MCLLAQILKYLIYNHIMNGYHASKIWKKDDKYIKRSYFPASTEGPGSTLYPVSISNLLWINGLAKVPDKCLLQGEVENEMKSGSVTDE